MNTLIVAACLMLTPGEKPAFEPLPKFEPVPQFDGKARDFPAFRAAVDAGGTPTLAVGVTPQPGDYTAPSLTNADGSKVSPGRWKCSKTATGYTWTQAINPAVFTPTAPVYQYTPLVPSVGVFRPMSGST
jgi:hypothetical protein